MADRYYVDQPLGPGTFELDGAEAHHLVAVCRMHVGEAVVLFNGDGREYPATIEAIARRTVKLNVASCESPMRELPLRLAVAAPLPKGDRAQFLVEKLTELGAASFTPLHTARSVVHPRETKLDKLQRHVIEASKQCGRNVLMEIPPLATWPDYLRGEHLPAHRVLAHPGGGALPRLDGADVAVAVGPEGGFTIEEVEAARLAGWQVIGLGPRVLRVETAALALVARLGSSHACKGE